MLGHKGPFFDKRDYLTGPRESSLLPWARNALAVLGVALTVTLVTPIDIWWAEAMARPWQEGKAGTLVIYAGQGTTDPEGGIPYLDDSSYWRSVYTVRSWRDGQFSHVNLFGGGAAREMAGYLRAAGIPADRLLVLPATSLADSARQVGAQKNLIRPVVLLTSDFHIPRAKKALQTAGLQPVIDPFPDAIKRGQRQSWYKRLSVLGVLASETYNLLLGR